MTEQPSNTTTFDNKTAILADLWMNYRGDEEFNDFIEYNDIGLPLAFMLDSGLAKASGESDKFINETFDLLLTSLGIEDEGFETLDDLFGFSTK